MAKRKAPAEVDRTARSGYEAKRERARQREAEQTAAGQDIGRIPPPKNRRRRKRCEGNFRAFCETYYSAQFTLAWSPDHLTVIDRIEKAVLQGGLFALAMPRGSGKTTLAEAACVWAILCGHRRFIALIGSDKDAAVRLLASIKTELETNELLGADFPEACFPIVALEGSTRRCQGQRHKGERTYIEWREKHIVLATIQKARCSGAIVRTYGLTGGIRGARHKLADGTTARPDLAIIDDPQTDDSARSASQNARREAVLSGAVLGLAGPGKKIAAVMPCTVICREDMADRILDREKHPEWQGERTKLVYQWPTDTKLWDQYRQLREDDFRAGGDGGVATKFYAKHRAPMDAGFKIAWPERFNPDELSAQQHAMNLLYRLGEAAFYAEYQNEPRDDAATARLLTAEQIAGQVNQLARGCVPKSCEHLTAFVDVHDLILYWMACAWDSRYGGYVVDYGTYPEQPVVYFDQAKPPKTLPDVAAVGSDTDAAIAAGLGRCVEQLAGRDWPREDGAAVRIRRLLIDAGYKKQLVQTLCRRSPHAAILMASHGMAVTAKRRPLAEYKDEPGARKGWHWRMPPAKAGDRHVLVDVNHYKTFAYQRLALPVGTAGAWSIFGRKPQEHRLLADHLTAEKPKRQRDMLSGREVDEWELIPNRDNHWLDCLIGCAAAASIEGVAVAGTEAPTRKPMSLAAMQRRRRG